jgi:hypothetical protein
MRQYRHTVYCSIRSCMNLSENCGDGAGFGGGEDGPGEGEGEPEKKVLR